MSLTLRIEVVDRALVFVFIGEQNVRYVQLSFFWEWGSYDAGFQDGADPESWVCFTLGPLSFGRYSV
jgi:hypothetical protein